MGYDLILTAAPVESDFGEALRRIPELTDAELKDIVETCLPWLEDEEDNAGEVRRTIEAAFRSIVDPMPRDVVVFLDHYVTGGLSYGDAPTDSYGAVELIAVSGITDDDYWNNHRATDPDGKGL